MRARSAAARFAWSVAMVAVVLLSAAGLHGEPKARVAPARPAAAVVRPPAPRAELSTWARAIGFEHGWITPGKELRLKSRLNELVFEVDRREAKLNGLRLFMGDAATPGKNTLQITEIDRDRFLLPILAPQRLAPMRPVRVIALDAGHGGRDRGTRSEAFKLDEKNLSLDLAKRLKLLLEARGYSVFMTRTDDSYIPLPERPKLAAAAGAELFVSIHFNAAGASVRGIETYVLTPQHQRSTGSDMFNAADDVLAPGNAFDGWNAYLGYVMHRQLVTDLKLPDRGLKRARFVVLRDLAACPGLLVECGYLSHNAEAKLINEPAYRDRLATTIAAGLDAFNQRLTDIAAVRAGTSTP